MHMKRLLATIIKSFFNWVEWMRYPECPECGGSLHVMVEDGKTVLKCDECNIKYTVDE